MTSTMLDTHNCIYAENNNVLVVQVRKDKLKNRYFVYYLKNEIFVEEEIKEQFLSYNLILELFKKYYKKGGRRCKN